MARPRFRQLQHTADVRLAVWGDSEGELIENGIAGTLNVVLPGLSAVQPTRWEEVEDWPEETILRLVKTINEVLFWLYCRGHVAVAFANEPAPPRLALAPLPAGRFPEVEVKAATLHGLTLGRQGGRLRTVVTLDL